MKTKTKKIKLGDYDFQCPKCKRIHTKSAYCVAQQTMHHSVTFPCVCGKKIEMAD